MKNHYPIVAPFRGLRYNQKKVEQIVDVVAPPYDVINEEGQKTLYKRHPYNVIRLDLAQQSPTDSDSDNRYTRSAKDLKKWIEERILVRDQEPSFYLYEQQFQLQGVPYTRRGFFAVRRLEGFGEGKIQPHEKTLAGPKEDRLSLMKATGANLSPIFSLYSDASGELTRLLEGHFKTRPWTDFEDADHIRHRFWAVADPTLAATTDKILGPKKLFIADGHHRYETALAFRDWMKKHHPEASDEAGYNYVMMFFTEMSDPGLLILPTHRVLQNCKGFDFDAIMTRLKEWFTVHSFSETESSQFRAAMQKAQSEGRQAFGIVPGGQRGYLLLELSSQNRDRIPALQSDAPAARAVDTLVLHRVIFQDLLGLKEEEQKDPRFVRFIKDWDEAIAARTEKGVNAVFLMNSPPMNVLQKVVDAGMVLPPKTTFFYPKIPTGLVFNQLDNDRVVI